MIKFEKKQWSGASILLLFTIIPLIFLNGGFDNLWVYCINIVIGLGILFLYQQTKLETIQFTWKSPGSWLLIFVIWGFLSVFWSVHPHRTLVEAIQLLLGFLAFLLAYNVEPSDDEKIINMFSVAGAAAAVYSTMQYLVFSSYDGTLANANPFSIMMVMISLLCWGVAIKKPTVQWGAMIICALMISQVLVFSSRMSLLALIIASFFLFWRIEKQQMVKKLLETIGLIIITILISQLILVIKHTGAAPSLTATVVNSGSMNRTFLARVSFFRQAFRMFLRRPIQGYGLGTFFLADNILLPDSGINSRFVHNHYLQVMAELGITGFVFFIGLFITTCINIWKQLFGQVKQQYYGYIAVFIAFAMSIFSDMTFNFPVCMVLCFMAIGFIQRDTMKTVKVKRMPNVVIKIAFVLALLITLFVGVPSWQYEQIAKEPSIDVQIKRMSQVNQFYPMNSGAHLFVSERYEYKYKETGIKADLDIAIMEAQKAIQWCPVDGKIYHQLGQLYLQANETEKAEESMILARNHAGTDLSRYIDLAYFYMWKNEYQQARDVLTDGTDKAKKFTEFERKHAVTNYIEQMTNLLSDIESKE